MITDQNVLVTGGAGFIGSHVVRELSRAGANVLAVDNCFSGSESLIPEDVRFEMVDVRDAAFEETVLDYDPTAIIHLAALHYIPYCNEHPEETFRVNVMGTRNLLAGARQLSNLSTVVFGSSAAVYPPRKGPHDESSETGPIDIYGETKLVGEDLMKLFSTETDVATATVRLFNVYGPNETNEHLIPAILKQVRRGDRQIELGNLTPKRDFVHVTDVVSAVRTLVEEFDGRYSTYNVGSGIEYSVREVVEKTSEALGEELEVVQDEERVRESDRPHLRADVSRIRTEFGWDPDVDFATGLRDLLGREETIVK